MKLSEVINKVVSYNKFESDNDINFFKRVYNNGDLEKYENRIKAIDFINKDCILDAGCGFGQWSIAFSKFNKKVIGTDADSFRIKVVQDIASEMSLDNVKFETCSMESIPYEDGYFDAIFSYNAITLGPYRKILKEFYRVLKVGGYLYFNAADLGWFIYNIIDQHNSASDFSSRQWAIDTIKNTLQYYATNNFIQVDHRDSLLIPKEIVKKDLSDLGFEVVAIEGDGLINLTKNNIVNSFFPSEKYGLPAVYEVLCKKINK